MAPKTGSKKPVETWRPERDLDCIPWLALSQAVAARMAPLVVALSEQADETLAATPGFASSHVRTEPQSVIGRTRGKKIELNRSVEFACLHGSQRIQGHWIVRRSLH